MWAKAEVWKLESYGKYSRQELQIASIRWLLCSDEKIQGSGSILNGRFVDVACKRKSGIKDIDEVLGLKSQN